MIYVTDSSWVLQFAWQQCCLLCIVLNFGLRNFPVSPSSNILCCNSYGTCTLYLFIAGCHKRYDCFWTKDLLMLCHLKIGVTLKFNKTGATTKRVKSSFNWVVYWHTDIIPQYNYEYLQQILNFSHDSTYYNFGISLLYIVKLQISNETSYVNSSICNKILCSNYVHSPLSM